MTGGSAGLPPPPCSVHACIRTCSGHVAEVGSFTAPPAAGDAATALDVDIAANGVAASCVGAFELPPEFDEGAFVAPHLHDTDADCDEDVFGFCDDLGPAAYHEHP